MPAETDSAKPNSTIESDLSAVSLVEPAPGTEGIGYQPAEIERLTIENDRAKEELDGLRNENQHRREFPGKIFTLVCSWLFFVAILTLAQAVNKIYLSDIVLVSLVSGATVNVIGLVAVVLRYFFPGK